MQESGPEPDERTYNTVLNICGRAGQASLAQTVMQRMHDAGHTPGVVAYGCLLNACARAREVGRAWKTIKVMTAAGVQPNNVCYTSFMSACVSEGSPQSLAKVRKTAAIFFVNNKFSY